MAVSCKVTAYCNALEDGDPSCIGKWVGASEEAIRCDFSGGPSPAPRLPADASLARLLALLERKPFRPLLLMNETLIPHRSFPLSFCGKFSASICVSATPEIIFALGLLLSQPAIATATSALKVATSRRLRSLLADPRHTHLRVVMVVRLGPTPEWLRRRCFGIFAAFSIIRFRAISPQARDIGFIFLALAAGLGVGARPTRLPPRRRSSFAPSFPSSRRQMFSRQHAPLTVAGTSQQRCGP